ncbi:MAG: glutamyl-tRNA reductase [Endozoicomonadaceae bacterium]|nr:glutamyl-tRNA reductase [Endozoicomonadaceae bacterium]
MKFLVIGINHKTTPISIREKAVFAPEALMPALRNLASQAFADEAVIISTCNRTEIYTYGAIEPKMLYKWWKNYCLCDVPLDFSHLYIYTEIDAIKHAMRVASGLDSMILGEPQILGQLKSAYAVSRAAKTLGGTLELMFQHTFAAAKKVRTNTAIGQNPISVAYATVQLALQIFSDLRTKTVLLIGAGKTVELVCQHLYKYNIKHTFIANRTLERAFSLAKKENTSAILLGEIPGILHQADIIISSTASQLPILGKGAVEQALKKRKRSPVLMIDISVPRDIEPEVATLSDVYLYSVDDLKSVISDNIRSREKAAEIAGKIISNSAEQLLARLRSRDAVCILRLYRKKAEAIKKAELEKALRLIATGKPFEKVMVQMVDNLTKKLIHAPCVAIRESGSYGETEKINWAQELLGISVRDVIKDHEDICN